MKEEVFAAVKFFACFLEKSEKVPREQLSNFEKHLTDLLIERFEKHWFPDLPSKGQGYRCIRVNCLSPVDFTLEMAAVKCGLRYKDLRLPTELTVWVDPSEVCYRLGESEGSYCTLASFPQSDASSTTSSSSNPPSTSSSPRALSPASTPRSPLQSPIPTHGVPIPERQPMKGRRQGHAPRTNSMARSPPSGAYQGNGFDYGSPVGKFRTNQGGFVGNGGGRSNRQSQREMNFNTFSHPHHRPMYPRCDGPSYPMAPHFYRNMTNRNYHKNVLRV
ncbi:maternal B9.15 protein-like [Euwallacea similis]|uniref:maternal B9.15 protein-like n=1 Tax=Euwallacea similis TaxID=1736056 RepID=UPI00344FC404